MAHHVRIAAFDRCWELLIKMISDLTSSANDAFAHISDNISSGNGEHDFVKVCMRIVFLFGFSLKLIIEI